MSRKEVPRAGLLSAARAGKITNAQGAVALRVSVRQFQRLKRRYVAEGAAGLRHRLRGRPSPRRLAPALRARAAALLQGPYAGLNDCHATEKLQEVEGLRLSRSSVRRLRRALGQLAKRRRRPRQGRMRRTPEAQMGALVQLDASPFAWLEERGPRLTLHGAIDDATGTGLALVFRPTEDLHGYVTVLQQLSRGTAAPWPCTATASGSFSATIGTGRWPNNCAAAKIPPTLAACCRTSGSASSPRTRPRPRAASSGSGRPCKIDSSAHCTCAGSTPWRPPMRFSPDFLADLTPRFARPPADPQAAWRAAPRDLAAILSCRYSRVVAADNTVHLGARWVQLPRRRAYTGRRLELRECLDGRLLVFADGHQIATPSAAPAAFILRPLHGPSADRAPRGGAVARAPAPAPPRARLRSPRAAPRKPSPAHPWRHSTPYSTRSRGVTFSRNS